MGFSRQNTGVGCHALLQRIFLTQGLNPGLLTSPTLAGGFLTTSATWKAHIPWRLRVLETQGPSHRGVPSSDSQARVPVLVTITQRHQQAESLQGPWLPLHSFSFFNSLVNLGALESLPHLLGCAALKRGPFCVNHKSVWCIFSCIYGIKKTQFLLFSSS